MTTSAHVLSRSNSLVDRIVWISFFVVITGLSAWVEIPLPFTPVPITLQTFAVVVSGIVLGRDGLISQLVYLLLGGIGLPLFAGGAGHFTYLFGATGGYLIGFVAAAAVAGHYVHPTWSQQSYGTRVLKLLGVSLLVFIPGVLQLALVLKLSILKALLLGFVPFIPGDIIKTLLAAGIPNRVIRKTA